MWQLKGGQAHTSLAQAVDGFPIDRINEKFPNGQYGPWPLMEHIRLGQWDILDFIRNPHFVYIKWPDDYWPDTGYKASETDWRQTLKAYEDDLRQLIDIVADSRTDLYAKIPHGRSDDSARDHSDLRPPRLPSGRVRDHASGDGHLVRGPQDAVGRALKRATLTDLALSTFKLTNNRGYAAPPISYEYREVEGDVVWYIHAGGTRLYMSRLGNPLDLSAQEQPADAYFMGRRVTTSLLLSGAGFFRATLAGRILLEGAVGHVDIHHEMEPVQPSEYSDRAADWFGAIANHTTVRRAADDAYLALDNPHEALIYVYRGFEWITQRDKVSWDQIASDVGVASKEMRDLKRMANDETGVRHASKVGGKLRADIENYGTWVCALIDALNASRARHDSGFTVMTPTEVAQTVTRAISLPFQ